MASFAGFWPLEAELDDEPEAVEGFEYEEPV